MREKRETLHSTLAIARQSRCIEAADILGLGRIPNKDDAFAIAGIMVVDLHIIRSISTLKLF